MVEGSIYIYEDWSYEETDSGLWKTRRYTKGGEEGYESCRITYSEVPAGAVVWNKRTKKNKETDPLGKDQHEGGAKLDAGKPRVALVMKDFAHALWEVARVGTYGAEKYCDSGWVEVPDGINRYDDAMMRHKLKDWMGEKMDTELPVEHLAQVAWNALAILERRIREEKDSEA
jgi:hypothetical protein